MCNGVLCASGAGAGARGTKSSAVSRISKNALQWYSTTGKRVWNKSIGSH